MPGVLEDIVVQYDEVAFLDYSIVTTMDQSVLEEPGFSSGSVHESAGLTPDLEVRSELVFANDDEFLAIAAQALKPLVDDVALPLDVRWPGLTFLFESGIGRSPRHGSIMHRSAGSLNVSTGGHAAPCPSNRRLQEGAGAPPCRPVERLTAGRPAGMVDLATGE